MKLFISSLDDMRQFHGKVNAVISIIDPDEVGHIPEIGAKHRLVLYCHDVDSFAEASEREREMPGSRCLAPTEALVKSALDFALGLPSHTSLLVHCGYGISRSTAIAFAILCQARPKISEQVVLHQVIELRPQASPNMLIVEHADILLKRKGRMISAVKSVFGPF